MDLSQKNILVRPRTNQTGQCIGFDMVFVRQCQSDISHIWWSIRWIFSKRCSPITGAGCWRGRWEDKGLMRCLTFQQRFCSFQFCQRWARSGGGGRGWSGWIKDHWHKLELGVGLATVLLDKPFVASCKTQECTCFLPMSDFLARVPTSHNNPAPKEGEKEWGVKWQHWSGQGSMEQQRYVPTLYYAVGWGGGGVAGDISSIEY